MPRNQEGKQGHQQGGGQGPVITFDARAHELAFLLDWLDPIQFGVVLVVNLMIHGLTPPLGILVYVVSGIMRVPAGAVFRAVLPLLGVLLAALMVLSLGMAAWPALAPGLKALF